MISFSSEYECKLDDKGRIVLPARIKGALPDENGTQIVLKRGFEKHLTIYPYGEWMKIFEKVASLNEFNEEDRLFQRMFLRGNTEVELDKAGRFLIPRSMARYAGLEREAILVGLGKRVEVWNPEIYDEYLMSGQERFSKLAERYLGNLEAEPQPPAEDEMREAS